MKTQYERPAAHVAAPLAVSMISKSYGQGPTVLSDVSFEVDRREIVGVIGPNGSGKTTLFGIIAGQLSPNSGTVTLDGRNVTGVGAAQRARAGVARTFQVPQSFGQMSVFENLLVAARFAGGLSKDEAAHRSLEILQRTGLIGQADQPAQNLPLLDRKRLELARALAAKPRILLLDEIAGGLTDKEAFEIAALVRDVNSSGIAVIWIEHLVHVLTRSVDRLIVLGEGRIIADGLPADTMQVPAVRRIYLGMEPGDDAVRH